jgi:hypothetical protein
MTKIPEPWVCNICGTQKRETNRWWLMSRIETLPGQVELVLQEWNREDADLDIIIHLCGEECASNAQSQFMRGQWPPLPRGTFPPVKSSSSQEGNES